MLGDDLAAAARAAARQRGADLFNDLLTAAALQVSIPMTGTAKSPNLAVAAGVLRYEVRRRAWRARR